MGTGAKLVGAGDRGLGRIGIHCFSLFLLGLLRLVLVVCSLSPN